MSSFFHFRRSACVIPLCRNRDVQQVANGTQRCCLRRPVFTVLLARFAPSPSNPNFSCEGAALPALGALHTGLAFTGHGLPTRAAHQRIHAPYASDAGPVRRCASQAVGRQRGRLPATPPYPVQVNCAALRGHSSTCRACPHPAPQAALAAALPDLPNKCFDQTGVAGHALRRRRGARSLHFNICTVP